MAGSKQPTKLDRLWVLNYLNRIKREGLLARRYDGVLRTMIDLVKSGRVKLDFLPPRSGQEDLSNQYVVEDDRLEVYFSDLILGNDSVKANFEGSILHELGHAVQDANRSKLTRGILEAEVNLMEADYLIRAYPAQTNESWVIIETSLNGGADFSLRFGVPRRLTSKLRSVGEDAPAYRTALTEVAEQYLAAEMFLNAMHSTAAQKRQQAFYAMAKRKAGSGDFNATQEIQKVIDAFRDSEQEHIAYRVDGTTLWFDYSPSFTGFLAVCRVVLHQSWQTQSKNEAQRTLDEMYELFRLKVMPSGSKLFAAVNMTRTFDGIE